MRGGGLGHNVDGEELLGKVLSHYVFYRGDSNSPWEIGWQMRIANFLGMRNKPK
ncbi:hypothetical protein Pan97_45300 [Bremerella volcania]|uniref:Uncharacterized protein n=1 Tax=Bremerella volcania TaxID=2527984 RepID=A0A518CE05_9BACT|nr:hypothetical protein Pan97_45300 [Bremerella volcania]